MLTIVRMDNEDCWVAILDGARGWVPAKFVQLIPPRDLPLGAPSSDGRDGVGDAQLQRDVGELVRDRLCVILTAIMRYGFRGRLLRRIQHIWDFIVRAVELAVGRDIKLAMSYHILSSAFGLERDTAAEASVSPAELLYRSVQAVQASHEAVGAGHDAKVRMRRAPAQRSL